MPLRLPADENFPGPVVRQLRSRGHDVLWVRETYRGAADHDVLELGRRENRVVVTFDKDFGELAFRDRLPATCGVVLFRLSGSDVVRDNAWCVAALESREDWAGHFAVVTDDRIRLRLLLAPPSGQ